MIWKETGVCKGSYMCFFNTDSCFQKFFYYMVSCGFFQCDKNYRVFDRGTRPPIFLYITAGSLEIVYKNFHYTAYANDIVLINCLNPQEYYCTDTCEFLFFHYNGSGAPALTDYLIHQNDGPIFKLENARDIYQTIREPIMRLCYQEEISDSFLSSLVYTTLCQIQERFYHTSVSAPEEKSISEQVIDYINKHIQKQFSLQELSDYVNLSPYYFSRLFKKETGHSPIDYVAISKINYAKLMLRTTALSISEIGDFLGYSSSASFINAFKSRRGISPKKYRDLIAFRMKSNIPSS